MSLSNRNDGPHSSSGQTMLRYEVADTLKKSRICNHPSSSDRHRPRPPSPLNNMIDSTLDLLDISLVLLPTSSRPPVSICVKLSNYSSCLIKCPGSRMGATEPSSQAMNGEDIEKVVYALVMRKRVRQDWWSHKFLLAPTVVSSRKASMHS